MRHVNQTSNAKSCSSHEQTVGRKHVRLAARANRRQSFQDLPVFLSGAGDGSASVAESIARSIVPSHGVASRRHADATPSASAGRQAANSAAGREVQGRESAWDDGEGHLDAWDSSPPHDGSAAARPAAGQAAGAACPEDELEGVDASSRQGVHSSHAARLASKDAPAQAEGAIAPAPAAPSPFAEAAVSLDRDEPMGPLPHDSTAEPRPAHAQPAGAPPAEALKAGRSGGWAPLKATAAAVSGKAADDINLAEYLWAGSAEDAQWAGNRAAGGAAGAAAGGRRGVAFDGDAWGQEGAGGGALGERGRSARGEAASAAAAADAAAVDAELAPAEGAETWLRLDTAPADASGPPQWRGHVWGGNRYQEQRVPRAQVEHVRDFSPEAHISPAEVAPTAASEAGLAAEAVAAQIVAAEQTVAAAQTAAAPETIPASVAEPAAAPAQDPVAVAEPDAPPRQLQSFFDELAAELSAAKSVPLERADGTAPFEPFTVPRSTKRKPRRRLHTARRAAPGRADGTAPRVVVNASDSSARAGPAAPRGAGNAAAHASDARARSGGAQLRASAAPGEVCMRSGVATFRFDRGSVQQPSNRQQRGSGDRAQAEPRSTIRQPGHVIPRGVYRRNAHATVQPHLTFALPSRQQFPMIKAALPPVTIARVAPAPAQAQREAEPVQHGQPTPEPASARVHAGADTEAAPALALAHVDAATQKQAAERPEQATAPAHSAAAEPDASRPEQALGAVASEDAWLLAPQPRHTVRRDLVGSGEWPAARAAPLLAAAVESSSGAVRRNGAALADFLLDANPDAFLEPELLASGTLLWLLQLWARERATAAAAARAVAELWEAIAALVGSPRHYPYLGAGLHAAATGGDVDAAEHFYGLLDVRRGIADEEKCRSHLITAYTNVRSPACAAAWFADPAVFGASSIARL
jgi:hypothetical protein